MAGVLLTPLIYVLARRLFNRPVALLTAFMILLSPLIEWYSHELRMYTVVVSLSILSTYAFYNALYPRRGRSAALGWAFWAVSIGVACASHYPFVGLFAAHL